MFFRKCEKKGHPYIALMVGALAVVGAFAIKNTGMEFIKKKWKKLSCSMKNINMPVCNSGDECGE